MLSTITASVRLHAVLPRKIRVARPRLHRCAARVAAAGPAGDNGAGPVVMVHASHPPPPRGACRHRVAHHQPCAVCNHRHSLVTAVAGCAPEAPSSIRLWYRCAAFVSTRRRGRWLRGRDGGEGVGGGGHDPPRSRINPVGPTPAPAFFRKDRTSPCRPCPRLPAARRC